MKDVSIGFTQILEDPKWRWVWHLFFWIYIYLDVIFSIFGITPEDEGYHIIFLGFLLDVAIVYINLYVLSPKFLLKGKYLEYIFFTFFSLILVLTFNYYAYETHIYDPEYWEEYWLSINLVDLLDNSFMIGMALSFKFLKSMFHSEKKIQEISQEQLKTELGFLRNQVNPHFLFNTMNSFYIQAKKGDQQLPENILSLSDLLRYQIYNTQKEFVSLKDELEYLKNYLDLENTRRDNLNINFESVGSIDSVKIAPLLLITMVENAVKYSQRTDGARAIINIKTEVVDERIYFTISNTKGKVNEINSPDSGVGLSNLTKRLELIYPDDHQYATRDSTDIFTTSLILGQR